MIVHGYEIPRAEEEERGEGKEEGGREGINYDIRRFNRFKEWIQSGKLRL